MKHHRSTRELEGARLAEASTSTVSEIQSEDCESESPVVLPSLDSSETINVPSEGEANSGPSVASTSVSGNNYFVFLSFRGPDTRKGFVDHLYHRLKDVGLGFHPNFVFRDDENLRVGEKIDGLLDAIRRSAVSIPVISENYAASEWCLKELIQIMECVERGEQKVYPVLYKVKPSDVREMKGKFGDAFRCHKHGFAKEVKRKGREALNKAANLTVIESEKDGGYEGKLVKQLVETILREQQHHFRPHLPGSLVATEHRVAEFMKVVDIGCPDTRIIGIYGMGGVGKTTLATIIYKKLLDKFDKSDCHCFLKDIRETIKTKGIEHVQSLLISNITKNPMSSTHTGIQMIRSSCENKRALILLDDIDDQDHLKKLIEGCKFGSGSRIIITCRDQSLLKPEYKRFKLSEMNSHDSLLLFSRHAFGIEQPAKELRILSTEIVDVTRGLPLALVIIGSLLKGKPENIWKETLEKLKKVPNKDVQKVLRISYDSLEYEQQQIFLDVSCFFIGIHKRVAIYFWEDLFSCGNSALDRLDELSLIKFDDEDKLRMHDHLRDLGRAIARPVDKKPWDCSRVWGEEAITIQRSKVENRNIEALHLDGNGSSKFMERRSFKRMPFLKFLHLSKVKFFEDIKDSLSELRWLEWEMCPDSFDATKVHLEKLLILDLSYGFISETWKEWSSIEMKLLKVLNLSKCSKIKKTPDLSAFTNLEMLILEDCRGLNEVQPSIGNVTSLVSLNLRGCWNLKKLPPEIGKLKGLVSLDLSECDQVEELPGEVGELENLKELSIQSTAVKEIPFIGSLKKLETLNARYCGSLVELPDSISHLVNLSTLDLTHCIYLKELPENIGSLVKVQRLTLCCGYSCDARFLSRKGTIHGVEYENIRHNLRTYQSYDHLARIPNSIGTLEWLIELNLSHLLIQELPESIGHLRSLKIFKIVNCWRLSNLPRTVSDLGKLELFDASVCDKLKVNVPIERLSSLKILRLCLTRISSLPNSIDKLSCLEELDLEDCKEIKSLPKLPANLTVLRVTWKDRTVPQFSHLVHLKELTVKDCKFLEHMPELPSELFKLHVSWCDNLKELPSLSSLKLLSELCIEWCGLLTEIKGLEGSKSLGELKLLHCMKLSNLDGLGHLESLRNLEMEGLEALVQVEGLNRLKNLEVLVIYNCWSLKSLNLTGSTHLQEFKSESCPKLVKIEGLVGLEKLFRLEMVSCPSIETSLDISCYYELPILHIFNCGKLCNVCRL